MKNLLEPHNEGIEVRTGSSRSARTPPWSRRVATLRLPERFRRNLPPWASAVGCQRRVSSCAASSTSAPDSDLSAPLSGGDCLQFCIPGASQRRSESHSVRADVRTVTDHCGAITCSVSRIYGFIRLILQSYIFVPQASSFHCMCHRHHVYLCLQLFLFRLVPLTLFPYQHSSSRNLCQGCSILYRLNQCQHESE